MAPQTKKERNTQRRKRRGGFENKAYEMWELCGFQVLTVMQNPETGEFYTFRTMKKVSWNIDQIIADPQTQNKLPSDVEKIRSKRHSSRKTIGKRSRRARREVISHCVTLERVVPKDQGPPQQGLARAMPFLPDPPSFDLTGTQNQWYGGQYAPSEATRHGGGEQFESSLFSM